LAGRKVPLCILPMRQITSKSRKIKIQVHVPVAKYVQAMPAKIVAAQPIWKQSL